MKSLTQYIFESEMQSIWKPNKANAQEAFNIQDKLKSFFKVQKSKVSFENKSECRKCFKEFVATLSFGNVSQNLKVLSKYGLETELKFANFITRSKSEFEDKKYEISWIKDFDESALEREYKKEKAEGNIPKGYKKDEIEDSEIEDRDLIIYDRWDPYTFMVFPDFKGKRTKSTRHQVNMMAMDAHYELGIKYYDCYPILSKNYFGHEEELKKRADYQIGCLELNSED
jgi:hypothetical protein